VGAGVVPAGRYFVAVHETAIAGKGPPKRKKREKRTKHPGRIGKITAEEAGQKIQVRWRKHHSQNQA